MYKFITFFSIIALSLFLGFSLLEPSTNPQTKSGFVDRKVANVPTHQFKNEFINCDDAPEQALMNDDLPTTVDFLRIDCMKIGHAIFPLKPRHLWLLDMRHVQDIVYPDTFIGLASPIADGEIMKPDCEPKGHSAHFTDLKIHEFNDDEIESFLQDLPDRFKEQRMDPVFDDIKSITRLIFTTSESIEMTMIFAKLKEVQREKIEKREFDAFGKVCWPECSRHPKLFRHISLKELSEPAFLKDIDKGVQERIKRQLEELNYKQ